MISATTLRESRYGKILTLAIPIMAALASQSLLNVVDAIMVGRLGSDALAAVAVGSYLNFIAVSLLLGLGGAVQALVARAHGANNGSSWSAPMTAGILLGLIATPPITVFFYFTADPLIHWISPDPAVREQALPYFLMRMAGLFAVAMNFSFRGYWNGTNRPGIFLKILVASHLINVLLSYAFIYGRLGVPELGTLGAALGTTLSLCIGMLINGYFIWRQATAKELFSNAPSTLMYKAVSRIAIPTSLQQFSFALGMTLLFWIVGHYGTAQVAIAHVLISITMLLVLPAMGLGLAATTLVGQAVGRTEPQDAHRWCWQVSHVSLVLLGVTVLPLLIAPDLFLGLFLHDSQLIDLAHGPLKITLLTIIVDGLAMVFMNSLLSISQARRVFVASFVAQWLLFLPIAYVAVTLFDVSFITLWLLHLGQRVVNLLLLIFFWQNSFQRGDVMCEEVRQ